MCPRFQNGVQKTCDAGDMIILKKKQTDIKRAVSAFVFFLFIATGAFSGYAFSKAIDESTDNRATMNRATMNREAMNREAVNPPEARLKTPLMLSILTTRRHDMDNVARVDASAVSVKPDASADGIKPDASADSVNPDASAGSVKPDASSDGIKPDASSDGMSVDASSDVMTTDASSDHMAVDASSDSVKPDASGDSVNPDASSDGIKPDASSDGMSVDASSDVMTTDASSDHMAVDASSDSVKPDASGDSVNPDASFDGMGEGDASDDHFSWAEISSKTRFSTKAPIAKIRSGPGVEYDELWTVEKYYPVVVIDESETWYFFRDFEGDQGWIYKTLLDHTPSVITRKNGCGVRSGPGKTDEILFTVEAAIPFKILDHKEKWIQVEHSDGDRGWIHQHCVW